MKKASHQRGQTLLELIVSIGVVVFVMLGLVVAVTSSLRFSQARRNRSRAVKYAQEAIEITRQLRDANLWDTFLAYTNMTSKVWCLSKERVWTVDDGNCVRIDGIFTRNVTLTWDDPRVLVHVDVGWQDGNRVLHSQLDTYLTQWK